MTLKVFKPKPSTQYPNHYDFVAITSENQIIRPWHLDRQEVSLAYPKLRNQCLLNRPTLSTPNTLQSEDLGILVFYS